MAVLELAACECDASGKTTAQYGCGWTHLPLFGDQSQLLLDCSSDDAREGTAGAYSSLAVYDGTPRRLIKAAATLGVTRLRLRGDCATAKQFEASAGVRTAVFAFVFFTTYLGLSSFRSFSGIWDTIETCSEERGRPRKRV